MMIMIKYLYYYIIKEISEYYRQRSALGLSFVHLSFFVKCLFILKMVEPLYHYCTVHVECTLTCVNLTATQCVSV